MRSYKCSDYRHKVRDCKNAIRCFKWAGGHLLKHCNVSIKEGINSKMARVKLKIKVDYKQCVEDIKQKFL